ETLAHERVAMVLAFNDAIILNERKRIALLAMAARLPTMFGLRPNVEDGGLMSYGVELRESWRRTADFVGKILKGAKAGGLPMEFPTKLELVINLTAAKVLGLTVAPMLLARADEVIEWCEGSFKMKLPHRRQFLHLAAGASALPAVARIASAQAYPSRPVRIMVGFAAGSTSDIYARLVGQWLSERVAQPFVVENRPGAGGNIGTAAVVTAPPDGYTLLMIASANAINATLYERLNFDFLRDIAPIAGPIANPYVMVVNPSFPAKTVPEFVGYAKANPGKINMGSAGVGSTLHLSGELFKLMTGVDMVHVPNRS